MSPVKHRLTPAEVEALFAGKSLPTTAPRATRGPVKKWTASYDRCDYCRAFGPCLVSFSGDSDWSPSIPTDAPIRADIRRLRRELGKRTIDLCTHCVEEPMSVTSATVADDSELRLFEI